MTNNDRFAIELMRESYASYCYFVHREKWYPSKFHIFLANTVQEFIEEETGHPYDVLVLSTPPQHGKSMTVTETLPSWFEGKYPNKRTIVACYNSDFAGRFGRRNISKMEEFGEFIFGISLSKTSDRDVELRGESGGIIFRGIMSGITGNPGDLIIIDDPVKNRLEADSPTFRQRVWEEWENSIITRTQAGSKIIVIQTRWHEDDLAGRIIRNEENVRVVNLPVEAEENDPLGRDIGEALCPEIGKDNAWLKHFKTRFKDGMRAWNSLYQCRPTSEEGNIIKREWWKYYDKLPDDMPLKVISVDAAFKGNEDSDYVAIEVWGKRNADFYLIDMIRQRLNFPETINAIRLMNEKHPDRHSILIEDKANGPAIISVLRHEIQGIVPITPEGGKIARVNACSGIIESGNVWLPRFSDFTGVFVEEFSSFPNGVNDDCVDACSQFLNKFKYFEAKSKEDDRSRFEKDMDKFKNKILKQNRKRSGLR